MDFERIINKLFISKTFPAFLVVFSPSIIGLLIFFFRQSIGIPEKFAFTIVGIFYPYLQLGFWIYWIGKSIKNIRTKYNLNSKLYVKVDVFVTYSILISWILIGYLIISTMVPKDLNLNNITSTIFMYLSYILMFSQLFIFFTWIYGFWVLCKIRNEVSRNFDKPESMSLIFLFFMPFTFGVIHRNIRKLLLYEV
jgi:hypothetical protein